MSMLNECIAFLCCQHGQDDWMRNMFKNLWLIFEYILEDSPLYFSPAMICKLQRELLLSRPWDGIIVTSI